MPGVSIHVVDVSRGVVAAGMRVELLRDDVLIAAGAVSPKGLLEEKDTTRINQYQKLTDAGAKAVVLVATEEEGAVLVREVAALPPSQRVPVISHWGIAGGEFFKLAGAALQEVDLSVIQTFSFFTADKQMLARFMKTAE